MLATTYSKSGVFEIVSPNGKINLPPAGRCWRFSKETIESLKKDNRIWWGSDGNGVPRVKRFLSEMPDGIVPQNLMLYNEVGSNQDGNLEMKDLFGAQIFDYPKCTKLMERLIILANVKNDDLVLDFFSGSATMAHALMKYNVSKSCNIKYIMVQLPEEYIDKSGKYDFNTICDIGEERIRRAGTKIKAESGLMAESLDIGFRVLKLDSSNMKNVYYNPKEVVHSLLAEDIDNVKEDRTGLDLLFQVMLELGVELSAKIEEKQVGDSTIYVVNESYLVACFDKDVNDEVVKTMANIKPVYIVLRDASFSNDSANINCEQTIKTISPSTELKVI